VHLFIAWWTFLFGKVIPIFIEAVYHEGSARGSSTKTVMAEEIGSLIRFCDVSFTSWHQHLTC
jgi:hypothetical protein